jgi:hypothetical protein
MLVVKLKLETCLGTQLFEGEIGNISNLASMSSYSFYFEGRTALGEVTDYPRWCESVMGLVARCLAQTKPEPETIQDWISAKVSIFLAPGGRRNSVKHLAMATIRDNEDSTVSVESFEIATNYFLPSIPIRPVYDDPWSLAEHALRAAVFGDDVLPAAKPLDIPIFESGDIPYIRIRDIPEPTRTIFDEHMNYSDVPAVEEAGDAVYAWDWLSFLGAEKSSPTNFSEC